MLVQGEPGSPLNTISGLVTQSFPFSLTYRSTNYGTTYEKLNDKVGLKTVLSYLYVNPTNKRKVREVNGSGAPPAG